MYTYAGLSVAKGEYILFVDVVNALDAFAAGLQEKQEPVQAAGYVYVSIFNLSLKNLPSSPQKF